MRQAAHGTSRDVPTFDGERSGIQFVGRHNGTSNPVADTIPVGATVTRLNGVMTTSAAHAVGPKRSVRMRKGS